MYKVRIDSVGFEYFTGLLGQVPFTNGVSDRELTDGETSRLGASVRLVRLDNDEQVGAATDIVNARNVQAKVAPVEKAPVEAAKQPAKELKYSKEYLENLAQEGGIKAVRKVGDEFGVKNVQISSLIDEIIEAQTKQSKDV